MAISKTFKHGNERWRVSVAIRGKRVQRFFKTEAEARGFLVEVREGKNYGNFWQGLGDGEKCDLMNAYLQAKAKGISLTQAVNGFQVEELPVATVASTVRDYLMGQRKLGHRPSTIEQKELALMALAESFGEERLSAVTLERLADYIQCKGWAASTVNGVLNKIGPFFSWCIKRGLYVGKNPVAMLDRPKESDAPPKIFSVFEAAIKLKRFQLFEPTALPYLAIGMFAGIRPEEIQRLTWDDVSNGYIHVAAHKAKCRKRRLVTIQPNLQAWLDLGGQLPLKNKRRKLDRYKRGWSPDVMRHSFASYHLAKFQDAGLTANELGHGNQRMLFSHYRELVTKAKGEAWFEIWPQKSPDRHSSQSGRG